MAAPMGIFARNGSAWHQTKAALSNQSGDIAWLFQDKKQAEFAYQNAMSHSKLNGQSSLRLANLAIEAQDKEAAAYYLSTSQLRHPTDASYVGLANIFQQENQFFQALFTLQKADQLFPNNHYILTQLARTYESLQIPDSAQYFYKKAALSNEKNVLAQANLLYAFKKDTPSEANENPAIRANQLAIKLKNGTFSSNTPQATDIRPSSDLRDWAYLYNSMLFFKERQIQIPTKHWIEQGYANAIFPELQLLDAWQDYYHGKPLQALQNIDLLIKNDTSTSPVGLQHMLTFWKTSLLKPVAIKPIHTFHEAQVAIVQQPFQVKVLQQALPILNNNKLEKQAYDAALAALQWNEDTPIYYLIFAIQAYRMGEISYGNEAVQQLKKLNPNIYALNQTTLNQSLQEAIRRQNFN